MAARGYLTYMGACEGDQEYFYLKHLQKLINDGNFKFKVNFKIKRALGGSPSYVVKCAKRSCINCDEDKKVAIFDNDFKEDFKEAIELANKNKIIPAYSNINFNLFLILHKKAYYKLTTPEDMYEKDLRKIYKINKNIDIKSNEAIKIILNQITLDVVMKAIDNSIILNNKSKETQKEIMPNVYEQPYLEIHNFLIKVFEDIK